MLIRSNPRLSRNRRNVEMLALCAVFMALAAGLVSCTKEQALLPEQETLAPEVPGHTKAAPVPNQMLVSGLHGTVGSTVGPDGYLYVTEGLTGEITRIDPTTGDVSTYASGLPTLDPEIGLGGPVDVVFRNGTAYALVILVAADVGGSDTVGIYRIDGPSSHTVIADIGTFNMNNPPSTDFFIPTGVPYAIEDYRNGFLVTDGHMNRVLYITPDDEITILRSFDNIVPTGLALSGNVIYMAESGPTPHYPENGKLVSFLPTSPKTKQVASGAPLLVDVEIGFPHKVYALSQGVWNGVNPGDPADPNTGSLVRVHHDGTFTTISEGLNLPTSLEFIGNTAYIVNLLGEVWTVENIESTYPK